MVKSYQKLFENNASWIEKTNGEDPEFFKKLGTGQSPDYLWIGCSDSRVPAEQLTGTSPGDIFVHRNIANMVVNTDMSMLSVLDYSVNVLGVRHVLVVGHYGCGGVNAALGNKSVGLIDNWLRNIKDVYRLHEQELLAIEDPQQRSNRMVELNVKEQVMNVAKTYIVQNAWAAGRQLQIHGIVFDIHSGKLIDLNMNVGDTNEIDPVYKLDLPLL